MKGSRGGGLPASGVDLSLTGLRLAVSRRPGGPAPPGPVARSVSVAAGNRPARNQLEGAGPAGSRAVNNLRRSNGTTRVNGAVGKFPSICSPGPTRALNKCDRPNEGRNQAPEPTPADGSHRRDLPSAYRGQGARLSAWESPPLGPFSPADRLCLPPRSVEQPEELLAFFDSGAGAGRKPSPASPEKRTTWNVLDDQPRGLPVVPGGRSAGPVVSPVGVRRRETGVALAANFTANNRSNKGAVGNCVTTMVHNNYSTADRTPPPKSSNQAAPSLNNLIKATSREDAESGGCLRKSRKNLSRSNGEAAPNNAGGEAGPPGRKEVTEEEAERFIDRVNLAVVTIQRWYRRQAEQRRAGAAGLDRLLASKREERRRRAPPWEENLLERQRRGEAERRRIREEKARRARRAAVQELQQKRAQKAAGDAEPPPEAARAPMGDEEPGPRRESRRTGKRRPEDGGPAPGPVKVNNADAGLRARDPDEAFGPAPHPGKRPEDQPQEPSPREVAGRDPEPAAAAAGGGPSKGPLEELLDTLRLLEEEADPPPRPEAPQEDRHAWIDGEEEGPNSLTADNLERFGKLNRPPGGGAGARPEGALLSEAKLQSIISFLDEMDESERERPPSGPRREASLSGGGPGGGGEGREPRTPCPSLPRGHVGRVVFSERPPRERTERPGEDEIGPGGRTEVRGGRASDGAVPARPQGLPSEADQLAQLEQASAVAAEVTGSVLRLKLEVEEKKRAVALLQTALAQQRELTVRQAEDTEKELGHRLQLQREQYDAAIQRHLAFIDQLIEDKRALSGKCQAVVAELKQVEEKYARKIGQAQERHQLELKKLKEVMSATEKIRREKWIDEKTKKIKEITVRGLEPEIRKLMARHEGEVKKLKALHEAELLQADERAARRFVERARELRANLEREKEQEGQRERDLARQRYEKYLEQEEEALQSQRRRLYGEVAEEKERLAQQAARQRAELEDLRRQLEEDGSLLGRTLREEYRKGEEERERRHQVELEALKEQLQVEKRAWEVDYKKKEEAWMRARERELREEVRKGRDKEIERVIRRLEADVSVTKEECERAAESRVQRVRDKYEAELAELEGSERKLRERCADLGGLLGRARDEADRLRALLGRKEEEAEDARRARDRLEAERSDAAGVVRREFADRLAAAEEENRQLKEDVARLRARQRLELERVARGKRRELEEVHRRVKSAIGRKEETVNTLRKQYEAAAKRADHLEALLDQQRKQLLTDG
ncbi:centrosomal protein of 131 kDa [Ornithorhynchus anatinus]|uniref:centrosomal protein of 131 kDa n=1 Tax=Ornithorhynchus anatinus TaxID=9258 RepID=UPI0019D41872|nr:centrosomal protein of 131 kDa [Ornithorhynchus anatinus]